MSRRSSCAPGFDASALEGQQEREREDEHPVLPMETEENFQADAHINAPQAVQNQLLQGITRSQKITACFMVPSGAVLIPKYYDGEVWAFIITVVGPLCFTIVYKTWLLSGPCLQMELCMYRMQMLGSMAMVAVILLTEVGDSLWNSLAASLGQLIAHYLMNKSAGSHFIIDSVLFDVIVHGIAYAILLKQAKGLHVAFSLKSLKTCWWIVSVMFCFLLAWLVTLCFRRRQQQVACADEMNDVYTVPATVYGSATCEHEGTANITAAKKHDKEIQVSPAEIAHESGPLVLPRSIVVHTTEEETLLMLSTTVIPNFPEMSLKLHLAKCLSKHPSSFTLWLDDGAELLLEDRMSVWSTAELKLLMVDRTAGEVL